MCGKVRTLHESKIEADARNKPMIHLRLAGFEVLMGRSCRNLRLGGRDGDLAERGQNVVAIRAAHVA